MRIRKVLLALLVSTLSSCTLQPKSPEEELSSVMHELGDELDITFSFIPEIKIASLPEGFGATYRPGDNILTLSPLLFTQEYSPQRRENLRHEMGHAYADQRGEQLGSNWFFNLFALTYEEEIFFRLPNEGIGEYFESVGKRNDHFSDTDFPQHLPEDSDNLSKDEKRKLMYEGGYHFVQPLIKRYGAQRVVDTIIQSPPQLTGNLREDVLKYQKQVQDALRGEE